MPSKTKPNTSLLSPSDGEDDSSDGNSIDVLDHDENKTNNEKVSSNNNNNKNKENNINSASKTTNNASKRTREDTPHPRQSNFDDNPVNSCNSNNSDALEIKKLKQQLADARKHNKSLQNQISSAPPRKKRRINSLQQLFSQTNTNNNDKTNKNNQKRKNKSKNNKNKSKTKNNKSKTNKSHHNTRNKRKSNTTTSSKTDKSNDTSDNSV